MNEKIDRIHRFIDDIISENGEQGEERTYGTISKLQIVKIDVLEEERESPIGYGDNKEATIYVRNYGKYYRLEIIPISWLGFVPRPRYNKELPQVEQGIVPFFLCKEAKKDAEKSISLGNMHPGKFITKASTHGNKEIAVYQMKQGIVYCTDVTETTKRAHDNFFNGRSCRVK